LRKLQRPHDQPARFWLPLLFLLLLGTGLIPIKPYLHAEEAHRGDGCDRLSPQDASQAAHNLVHDHGTIRKGKVFERTGARSHTIRQERFYH
jgi:hypothetical protein